MNQVEFYFDFSCPWSYLALVRLRDVTDRNAAGIVFKPVSVDTVLATERPGLQQTRLAANPAKAEWQRRDLEHWAAMWGLTLNLPPNWPGDASLAGAGLLLADAGGKSMEFALAVFSAHFGSAADISAPQVLTGLAEKVGLNAQEFQKQLADEQYAAQVQDNSLELIRRGGFGTPSMFVADELYFGNDRVPLVEWTLGPVRDAQFIMPGQHDIY
jgi:2-hydroxychromene-2-carboxylate isomerase